MNKILSWAVMAALLMGCNTQVNGQAADDSSEQRKAKILENLQYQPRTVSCSCSCLLVDTEKRTISAATQLRDCFKG